MNHRKLIGNTVVALSLMIAGASYATDSVTPAQHDKIKAEHREKRARHLKHRAEHKEHRAERMERRAEHMEHRAERPAM
jgi:Ni/Co efflux regulator RcnB